MKKSLTYLKLIRNIIFVHYHSCIVDESYTKFNTEAGYHSVQECTGCYSFFFLINRKLIKTSSISLTNVCVCYDGSMFLFKSDSCDYSDVLWLTWCIRLFPIRHWYRCNCAVALGLLNHHLGGYGMDGHTLQVYFTMLQSQHTHTQHILLICFVF